MYRCRASGKRVYKRKFEQRAILKGIKLTCFCIKPELFFRLSRCINKVKLIKVGFGAVLDKRGIKHLNSTFQQRCDYLHYRFSHSVKSQVVGVGAVHCAVLAVGFAEKRISVNEKDVFVAVFACVKVGVADYAFSL